jgi:hypothetical protein
LVAGVVSNKFHGFSDKYAASGGVKVRFPAGHATKVLLARWTEIVKFDEEHGFREPALAAAIRAVWVAFTDVWKELHKKPDEFSKDATCAAIDVLKRAVARSGRARLVNNSLHVLIFHVPYYLKKYGSLTPFCQQVCWGACQRRPGGGVRHSFVFPRRASSAPLR